VTGYWRLFEKRLGVLNAFTLTLVGALTIGAPEVDVQLMDGSAAEGQFVRLSDKVLEVTSDGPRTFDVESLLLVTAKPPPAPPEGGPSVWIELVDGSRLLATQFTVSAGVADVRLWGGSALSMPTEAIRSVRLREQDRGLSLQWEEIFRSELKGDVLVVRKTIRDDDTGTESHSLDYLEGVLSDVAADSVRFSFEGEQVDVPRGKIEGLIYVQPAGRKLPDVICMVDDAAGSRFKVKAIRSAGNALELTLASGPDYQLPLERFAKLDFSAGRLVFLSDIEPTTVEWTAFLDPGKKLPSLARLFHPRSDQSFSGGKLRLRSAAGVQEYAKGLAIHSRTLLIYRIPPEVRRFQALAGIDESVRTGGHVRLEIRADNQELLNVPVVAGQEPLAIDLDVSGAERLKILVDFGEQLDIGDSLHLCRARLTK
jgi:hypothetical protein